MAHNRREHQGCGCISQSWQLLQTRNVVVNHRSRRDPMDKWSVAETGEREGKGRGRRSRRDDFLERETRFPQCACKIKKPQIALMSFRLALLGGNSGHVPVVVMDSPKLAAGQPCEGNDRVSRFLAYARPIHA